MTNEHTTSDRPAETPKETWETPAFEAVSVAQTQGAVAAPASVDGFYTS